MLPITSYRGKTRTLDDWATVFNLAIVVLWAWQSLVFLPADCRISFARMFEITALSTTATNTAPAFLGQAHRTIVLLEAE